MEIEDTLTTHLRNVITVLQQANIPYALAGGLAFSALVEPRATVDIDILILLQADSRQVLLGRLEPYFDTLIPHPNPMAFHQLHIWRVVGLAEHREVILDFLLAESGFHQNVLQRAMQITFLGQPLKVVTLEDLMIFKQLSGRPQDHADLSMIETLLHDEIDRAYIECWMKRLQEAEQHIPKPYR